jgi:hypothetical protein
MTSVNRFQVLLDMDLIESYEEEQIQTIEVDDMIGSF